MKLDRNIGADGLGKYALIKNRKLAELLKDRGMIPGDLTEALAVLEQYEVIDWGDKPETEFFVIRIKDKYASGALYQYASYAIRDNEIEYGQEVMALSKRSGEWHPNCKKPD
jgi:hypothetical protein